MNGPIIFSDESDSTEWSSTDEAKLRFGTKAGTLATLPRRWTPPFALVSAELFVAGNDGRAILELGGETISRIRSLGKATGNLIVRSSVIGETIWERGTYESVVIDSSVENFEESLSEAASKVLQSAPARRVGLVIQEYIRPIAHGDFGNLLRVSKTRDQWELSYEDDNTTSSVRFNAQRDQAADPYSALEIRPGIPLERLLGSVAAWLNNDLLRGISQRLNCEWITDARCLYLVQIDQEDEDFVGVNPFQIRIAPAHQPASKRGTFIAPAEGSAVAEWDKLQVLEELYDLDEPRKPALFYIPLSKLPATGDAAELAALEQDLREIIGPDNIVIRTSVRAGGDKPVNMRRTEGLRPEQAARLCLELRDDLTKSRSIEDLAFVIHRFMAARASAWARAEPGNPVVEIHGLWGLPDALQYCPYDIWEVHTPTAVATEFTEYKSHMLLAKEDGAWEYVRVKNELGRSLSIGRREAMDIASKTALIAERLKRPCHVMWFVGCVSPDGAPFSVPWYWTNAHPSERNSDRSNYHLFRVVDRDDLERFKKIQTSKSRYALELMPIDLTLMRDMDFIESVGTAATDANIPVILAGSTSAHAYFALRRQGCTVVARGEKEHTRVRRSANFGKIVRDKIPAKIAQRKEAEVTRKLPENIQKNFLISKLLEEALEVRNADARNEKTFELADLVEVVRALARLDGISFDEVTKAADEKRLKAGGFDEGLILLQTGILGRSRDSIHDDDKALAEVLAQKTSADTYELPFTFFGFIGN